MKDNHTPLKDIKFELVPEMAKAWEEKAKTVEGAADKKLDYIYFTLWVPDGERYWNTSNIDGTREEYMVRFNLDGTINEYKKM